MRPPSTAPAKVRRASAEKYLEAAYEPDADLVDGILEDTNVGEVDHYKVQRALLFALSNGEEAGGYFVVQQSRLQITPNRFRVPDTCLLPIKRLPQGIIKAAPLLCIEVVGPLDRVIQLQRRCQDYLQIGVPEVWIVNQPAQVVYVMRGTTTVEHSEGLLRLEGGTAELDLDEFFAALMPREPLPPERPAHTFPV